MLVPHSTVRRFATLLSIALFVHCSNKSDSDVSPTAGASSGAGTVASGGVPSSSGGVVTDSGGRSGAGATAVTGGTAVTAGASPLGGTSPTGGRAPAGGMTPTAGGAAAGSGGTPTGGVASGGASAAPALPKFLLGADISSMQEAVDGGTRYADTDGAQKGLLQILKAHGFNAIRLRAFVEPNAEYGYARGTSDGNCRKAEAYCDTAHTIEFAQEIKAQGMSFLLDLHYSDTWADPGKQIIPESFRDASTIAELAAEVKAYTTDVLTQLVAAGARPDLVQVGNEITPGLLIHVPDADTDCWGNDSTPNAVTGSSANWGNLSALLKAGIEAVRAVDPSILVMLHIENTDDLDGVRWWVQNAIDRDVEFDVLGLSCYTAFQGPPSTWRTTFNTLADEFPDLKFVIAEYNPERTQANQIIRDLPDGRGLGTYFWEPTQSGAWGESMFSSSGGVQRANAADFAEFDALRTELGL